MSGIVLSNAVRQNLSSLQATADLLATTQSRLSSGKKVNTALDNPTNFFTAASLDSRASDINNLLDGIGNGVQILQAPVTLEFGHTFVGADPDGHRLRVYSRAEGMVARD